MPFVESIATRPLVVSTVIVSIIGIALPFTHLGAWMGMGAMPLMFLPFLFGIILAYAVMVQLMKKLYINRYGHWI